MPRRTEEFVFPERRYLSDNPYSIVFERICNISWQDLVPGDGRLAGSIIESYTNGSIREIETSLDDSRKHRRIRNTGIARSNIHKERKFLVSPEKDIIGIQSEVKPTPLEKRQSIALVDLSILRDAISGEEVTNVAAKYGVRGVMVTVRSDRAIRLIKEAIVGSSSMFWLPDPYPPQIPRMDVSMASSLSSLILKYTPDNYDISSASMGAALRLVIEYIKRNSDNQINLDSDTLISSVNLPARLREYADESGYEKLGQLFFTYPYDRRRFENSPRFVLLVKSIVPELFE